MATKTKETVLGGLADLAKGLAEAAEDREKTSGILKEILGMIGELDKDDAKALFKDERVQALIEAATTEQAQSSIDPPGTIYSGVVGGQVVRGFVKKDWEESHLRAAVENGAMTLVDYEPRTTQVVIWNGLQRQFIADTPMTVEKCFVDVYRDSLKMARDGAEHAQWLFKKRDMLHDPTLVTGNGAKARATGERGHYEPGGGLIALRPSEEAGSE
jgi:hypothetical protein